MDLRKTIVCTVLLLFFPLFGLERAFAGERNPSPYLKTIAVLQELYIGEVTAARTYSKFAQRAEEEEYYSVARLFRALSESESVHARNFRDLLKELWVEEDLQSLEIKASNTKKNLRWAPEVELSEINTRYPTLIERIKPEGHEKAIMAVSHAWQSEMQHKDLIKKMKSGLWLFFRKIVDKLGEAHEYHVCQGCGSTVFRLPKDACVICGGPSSAYKRVR